MFVLLTSPAINMLGLYSQRGGETVCGYVCSKVQLQGAVLREQLSRKDCG